MRRIALTLIVCLLLSAGAAPLPATPPDAFEIPARISLKPGLQRLDEILEQLSHQLSLKFTADEQILKDPIICRIENQQAGAILHGLTLTMRYRIRRSEEGFHFDLEPAAAEMLERYRKLSGRLAEAKQSEEEGHFLSWLRDLSGRGSPKAGEDVLLKASLEAAPGVQEMVRLLEDADLELAAFGLTQPMGPIPSTGVGPMENRIFGERSSAELPEGLRGVLSAGGIDLSPGTRVGLALSGVGMAVSLRDETGLRWLHAASARIPEWTKMLETRRAREAELLQPVRSFEERGADWIDPELRELPLPGVRKTALPASFARFGQVHQGDRQLLDWSRASGLPLIADGFAGSTFLYSNDESPPQRLTLARWARLLAARFARRYRLSRGILLLRSRQGLNDRLREIPPAVLEDADRSLRQYGRLELLTLARMSGRLDDDQVRLLRRLPWARGKWSDLVPLDDSRLMLRLLAEQTPAEMPFDSPRWSGPLELKTAEQRRAFGYLIRTGRAAPAPAPPARGSGSRSLSFIVRASSAEITLIDGEGRSALYRVAMRPRLRQPAIPPGR